MSGQDDCRPGKLRVHDIVVARRKLVEDGGGVLCDPFQRDANDDRLLLADPKSVMPSDLKRLGRIDAYE